MITKIMFPVYSRIQYECERAETQRRMAEVAITLCRYRSLSGRYPAQLSQLRGMRARTGSPLPPDPYTGKAFMYRRSGIDYILYSLGDNRADDGGHNGQYGPEGNHDQDDLVWMKGRF
jgi:hypothetical protein